MEKNQKLNLSEDEEEEFNEELSDIEKIEEDPLLIKAFEIA